MMEGMNQTGQEEYIWAMRTSAFAESDSDLWKERRGYILRESKSSKKVKTESIVSFDDHQTKVMASLVPDEVIYNVNDYRHRPLDVCLLFGDVSGFTELCERYNKIGLSGPSKMTQALNKYLGAMVQEVLSHNGDVLKFSGDAFLALFKVTEDDTMRDVVHQALDCALVIQKNYGSFLTDVGVVIRVKLAVSSGPVMFTLIGSSTNSHYVVVGKPIWDVKYAEKLSAAGDIIVAPAAWHYVNPNEYVYQDLPDGNHVKLTGIGPNWRSVQKNVPKQTTTNANSSHDDDSEESELADADGADEFSLRPAVTYAAKLKMRNELRKFIIPPVMKSIEMNEPFEYLTEMRQSVVVFINVISTKLETEETVILADETYKIVCGVVDKQNGCVNKVSLFDKDLMMVVIFGLRGLKHELECQIALKCASECHEEINKLPGVMSTSIGVTTGKTYCGVFGHTLRREYTVISLIVNKAARLMVAYQDKVTCDRETFLHSKLEAKHFILQEYKALKGISNPGPVYEFREVETKHDVIKNINPCPLLGGEEMVYTYLQMLRKCLLALQSKEEQYKMLLLSGVARQGKTRLLDELVYSTPPEIPINRFTLRKSDSKIPYQTMRLIFNLPLSLTNQSTVKEKEDKLLRMLRKMQVPELLCVLNNMFGVNFKHSELFFELSDQTRRIALRKMIKQLGYACFITTWVVAIDDCEYVDEESWDLFDSLFDVKMLFIVATLGKHKQIHSKGSNKILADVRVKTVVMKPIPNYYHGALACQILNVYGIPAELERAIQARSNGNPGWVESFLISLLQGHGMYILEADLKQINDLGLVCPPLYLMTRISKEETHRWQHIMEERRMSVDSMEVDYWKKYVDSCRDSYLNVTIRENMESLARGGKVAVAVTSPNFNLDDVEPELTLDVMILKTFDSLNSFEQLMIKCSAILGFQFPRDMLFYVMSAKEPRHAALAVQKLFEIKVLTCAKGDFIESGAIMFKERLINPGEDPRVRCECRGVRIDENCYDLPSYANCGYMQFRSSLFRDITHNLLTDQQKKEFHNRAIRYLERETRRCRACGNGFFDRILGDKHDKDFFKTKERKKAVDGSVSFDDASSTGRSSHSGGRLSDSSSRQKKSKFDEKSLSTFPSTVIQEAKAEKKMYESWFGISIINRLKNSFSLTKAFSSEDFSDCQCSLILNSTYAELVEHCSGAGDLDKLVEAMMEYSHICIITCNITLALNILDEALAILKRKDQDTSENSWKVAMLKGKIYTLIGYSRLELGHLDEALTNLHKSLAEYGLIFPKGLAQKMKNCSHHFKQFVGFYVFPSYLLKRLDYWETVYANNLSQCLSHMCTIYMMRGEWKNAELAAEWSLSRALQSYSDFQVICMAYANMIQVAQHFERWNLCVAMEVHALRLCHMKRSRLESQELQTVAHLYGVVFCTRVLQANIEKCVHIGYIVLRICSSIRAVKIILPLLPILMYCLMMGKHTGNAISILQELDYFADEDSDNSGKVWYYALALGFHLETGYNIVPYEMCEHFYRFEGENWVTIRDPDARKRYFTVMWLWCVRIQNWEAASIWCLKGNEFLIIGEEDSLANKISALYLLEGMILYLVSKLDKRNVEAIVQAENEIKHLTAVLEQAARVTKIILPRLYHLKAYYRFVKHNDNKVNALLKKATKFAEKYGNAMEVSFIEHSAKAWSKSLPSLVVDFWREHAEAENMLDFQELEFNGGKIGFFTLPTPLFV